MNGKIQLKCYLRVVTGLHIGGNSAFSAIGAVDKPVLIDPRSHRPILAGSSLKGKLRTLLLRSDASANQDGKPEEDPLPIRRLFGSMGVKNRSAALRSRLQFSDGFVSNADQFENIGFTEVKVENSLDRATGVANPRQIERVISGVMFECNIVYNVMEESELMDDLQLLGKGLKLLQLDYLGGHGTRGSGRISLSDIELIPHCQPDLSQAQTEAIKAIFEDIKAYELLSV